MTPSSNSTESAPQFFMAKLNDRRCRVRVEEREEREVTSLGLDRDRDRPRRREKERCVREKERERKLSHSHAPMSTYASTPTYPHTQKHTNMCFSQTMRVRKYAHTPLIQIF